MRGRSGWVLWVALGIGLAAGWLLGPLGVLVVAIAWLAGYISCCFEVDA